QAKETINRRVDELGLREASVTTRDEDIIVEVPGSNRAQFDEIKEIIRKTARLEFKMVDDEADFFAKDKVPDNTVPEGIDIRFEQVPAGLDEQGQKRSVRSNYASVDIPAEWEGKKTSEDEEARKAAMNAALDKLKSWVKTLP